MIIATTPRTAIQLIDYSRIPALQLPEGQNPEKAQDYYARSCWTTPRPSTAPA